MGDLLLLVNLPNDNFRILNHSTAHIMAASVLELFPNAKPTIGPSIEPVGFYYDFYIEKPFTELDLRLIENKMHEIINQNIRFVREKLSRSDAIQYYKKVQKNKFKIEILSEIDDEIVSFYSLGENGFKDLCKGPHIHSTENIKAIKLLNTSAVFWKGNPKRDLLQRIYGVAFFSSKDLKAYLQIRDEAEKRDHRKLGIKLDLFSTAEENGPGMPLYYPKGTIIWEILENFWRVHHRNAGYQIIKTPHMYREQVWINSGHVQFYSENMFPIEINGEKWYVKPMNCPGHMMIFNRRSYSYRELPVRFAEYGTVYRYEMSGVLHGLLRARGFTQDDAHIFMMPHQLVDEIINVIKMIDFFYKTFGFKEWVYNLSTRPNKAIGNEDIWNYATNSLIEALEKLHIKFNIKKGEGAFYGPKIDVDVRDAIGRMWQLATIQVDFNLPKRFGITYIGDDGDKKQPVMIHRVIYGAVDRFLAILIEHYGGKLPVWLSPIQAVIIPITDRNLEYAKKIRNKLLEKKIRAEVDLTSKRIGYKIRNAQLQKIPYMISVGDKEFKSETIAVRSRNGKLELGVSVKDFISQVLENVNNYQ